MRHVHVHVHVPLCGKVIAIPSIMRARTHHVLLQPDQVTEVTHAEGSLLNRNALSPRLGKQLVHTDGVVVESCLVEGLMLI